MEPTYGIAVSRGYHCWILSSRDLSSLVSWMHTRRMYHSVCATHPIPRWIVGFQSHEGPVRNPSITIIITESDIVNRSSHITIRSEERFEKIAVDIDVMHQFYVSNSQQIKRR